MVVAPAKRKRLTRIDANAQPSAALAVGRGMKGDEVIEVLAELFVVLLPGTSGETKVRNSRRELSAAGRSRHACRRSSAGDRPSSDRLPVRSARPPTPHGQGF